MGRAVLDRLLRAMAIGTAAAAGCADRALTIADGDEGPPPPSSSSDDEGAGSAGEEVGGVVTTGIGEAEAEAAADVDDGDDGVLFDIGQTSDVFVPPPTLDPALCTDPMGNPKFHCEFWEPDVPLYYLCIEPVPGESCDFSEYDAAVQANQCIGSDCASDHGLWPTDCGPDPTVMGACCFWLAYLDDGWCIPPEGRPFVVDGIARLADTAARSDWADAVTPDLGALGPVQREGLAAMWTDHARAEHASIASFSRFVLQLLSVGAPADLVEEAQRAMGDEIRHATAAFGLASAYAGRAIGPGRLQVDRSLDSIDGLEAITLSTVDEGCIAETIAAVQALQAAREATDPAVASVLRAIAEDELRHAELAWRFVRWAIGVGPHGLRDRVREALRTASAKAPRAPEPPEELDDRTMRRHGMLPPRDRAAISRMALREIVAPAATALLSVGPSDPSDPDPAARGSGRASTRACRLRA